MERLKKSENQGQIRSVYSKLNENDRPISLNENYDNNLSQDDKRVKTKEQILSSTTSEIVKDVKSNQNIGIISKEIEIIKKKISELEKHFFNNSPGSKSKFNPPNLSKEETLKFDKENKKMKLSIEDEKKIKKRTMKMKNSNEELVECHSNQNRDKYLSEENGVGNKSSISNEIDKINSNDLLRNNDKKGNYEKHNSSKEENSEIESDSSHSEENQNGLSEKSESAKNESADGRSNNPSNRSRPSSNSCYVGASKNAKENLLKGKYSKYFCEKDKHKENIDLKDQIMMAKMELHNLKIELVNIRKNNNDLQNQLKNLKEVHRLRNDPVEELDQIKYDYSQLKQSYENSQMIIKHQKEKINKLNNEYQKLQNLQSKLQKKGSNKYKNMNNPKLKNKKKKINLQSIYK